MYEHIYIKELEDGFYELKPYEGYILWNEVTQRKYSEAITKSTEGFVAILNGIPPEPHERTVEDAKKEKLAALDRYMEGNIKEFFVNGKSMWIGPNERANYKNALEALIERHPEVETINYAGINIAPSVALQGLAEIEVYALICDSVKNTHITKIKAKKSITTVDSYNFTTGFPEKLTFTV